MMTKWDTIQADLEPLTPKYWGDELDLNDDDLDDDELSLDELTEQELTLDWTE